MNKSYSLKARKFINCEDINSSFVCDSTEKICGKLIFIKVGIKHKIYVFIIIVIHIIIA